MHNLPNIDFIYLSEPDMIQAGVTNMAACVDTMEEMFSLMYHGDYRMAGPNNNSHGSVVVFPEDSPFPDMPKPTPDRHHATVGGGLGHVRERRIFREYHHRTVGIIVRPGHAVVTAIEQAEHLFHGIHTGEHVGYASADHVLLGQVDEVYFCSSGHNYSRAEGDIAAVGAAPTLSRPR